MKCVKMRFYKYKMILNTKVKCGCREEEVKNVVKCGINEWNHRERAMGMLKYGKMPETEEYAVKWMNEYMYTYTL